MTLSHGCESYGLEIKDDYELMRVVDVMRRSPGVRSVAKVGPRIVSATKPRHHPMHRLYGGSV